MELQEAHKGYEYQDLLTAYFISAMLTSNKNATFKIDKKESEKDKFDDFTMVSDDSILKCQIKYSEQKILQKADLSSEKYDLALDTLFSSWKDLKSDKKLDIRLCLAWEYIEESQELLFLNYADIENKYQSEETKLLKINLEKIWPDGETPITSWRRLKSKAKKIDRKEFSEFIEDLTIEVNLPKFSMDFENPEQLEALVLNNLKRFGVGKYPNHEKTITDVARHLILIIKSARANGKVIELFNVIFELGLKNNYGNIQQDIIIDDNINVNNLKKNQEFKDFLFKYNKVALLGEPGAGKSWFVKNFTKYLNEQSINFIQHYCYTGIDDIYEKERITTNTFLANLVNDLMKKLPYLEEYKSSKYGVDIEELQVLIEHIEEEVVLIVDGIDHIGRIYGFHSKIIREIDTKIVDIITKLKFSSNVKVVIVSQPASEVTDLCKNGFKKYELKPWSINEVKLLLEKNTINDCIIDSQKKISNLLLEKSDGNPLYLTYLINELSQYNELMLNKELIDNFPAYSGNLENYYALIMSKLSENQKVAQILAGSPFALTELELKEITSMGNYVDESLSMMKSILKYNTSTGGYIIYHESFRRYILSILSKNGVDVEKIIYKDLIEWLKFKGFYKHRKSYKNLLALLFETQNYKEILEFCSEKFIVDSLFYGNDIFSLKTNYEILMKAACKQKDYGAVIVATELSSMIYSLEYSFDENSEYYYMCLGVMNGYEKLKSGFFYGTNSGLSYKETMKLCYICSLNNVMPDWEKYMIPTSDNISFDIEEFKYYVCACLDTGANMIDVLQMASGKDEHEYRHVCIAEYSRRGLVEELKTLVEQIENQENWIYSISTILGENIIEEDHLHLVLKTLSQPYSNTDDFLSALKYYTYNISEIINSYIDVLLDFIDSIENRNWFYNWIIYVYKVNSAIGDEYGSKPSIDDRLIEAYSWLTKDVDCFKGAPRTCDLYLYEKIIHETIQKPLQYIKSKYGWKSILDSVEKMSGETMTTLSGTTVGPITTYKLFDMFLEIINEENNEIILDIFESRTTKESNKRYYTYLADYSMKYAIILFKSKKTDEAKDEFKKGITYLLSYSFRKDRTLSRLIDSVESICEIDSKIGLDKVLKLKSLADAVVHHTDGKGTRTYQREWFEVLIRVNKDIALTYLSQELINYDYNWILEESFDFLLESLNSELEPEIANILFQSRPNSSKAYTIKNYLNNIRTLINNNKITLAKQSMNELLSRTQNAVDTDAYNIITELCEILNINTATKIELVVKDGINYNSLTNKKLNSDNSKRCLSFELMEIDGVLEYIVKYGIQKSDVQSLFYYIQEMKEFHSENRIFIDKIISHIYENSIDVETQNYWLSIVENLSVTPSIQAYAYMRMFMEYKDGWYRRLTKTEFFIKAFRISEEVAEQCFFDYLQSNLYNIDYNTAIGDEIIKALSQINYDNSLVIQHWENLFEIISYRLPEKNEYNWNEIIELSQKFTLEEKLMYLLLVRLKYGEANRYKLIISGIDKILQDEKYRRIFVEPFSKLLESKDIINYALIVLLYLVKKRFKYEEIKQVNLLNTISSIYPTKNEVLNYLIRNITGKKEIRDYNKYKTNYKGKDEFTNQNLKKLKLTDNRISLLESRGIDVENIAYKFTKNISDEDFISKLKGCLYNSTYSSLIPNVYFYDILTKHMGNEIGRFLKELSGHPFEDYIEESLFLIAIDDLEYIIANCNSTMPRPIDLVKPEEVQNSVSDVEIKEWTTVAYQEKWYNKREKHKNNFPENVLTTNIISCVAFEFDKEETEVPILRLNSDYRIFDENVEIRKNEVVTKVPFIITTDMKLSDDEFSSFRPYTYLGIRSDILSILEIKMTDQGDGIVGVDKSGDIVLKYSKWEVCFNEFDLEDDRIPYLEGSQLEVKNNVFDAICELYNEIPKKYTVKFS